LLNPDFRDMLAALCDEEVEFLLVGAYALAAHGLPRATGDLDIWLRTSPDNARRTLQALVRFGASIPGVTEEDFRTPGNVIQVGVSPRRIDFLTSVDGVEFAEAWPRRMEVPIEGLTVPLIGREDLIRNKMAAGRPQDLVDVNRLQALGE
jgi:hypothetical protein